METPLPYIECLESQLFTVKISPSCPLSEGATVMLNDYVERTMSADIEVAVGASGENGYLAGTVTESNAWYHVYLIPNSSDSDYLSVTYGMNDSGGPDFATACGAGVPFRYIGTISMNAVSSSESEHGFCPEVYCGNQCYLLHDGTDDELTRAKSFTASELELDSWYAYDPSSESPSIIPPSDVAGEIHVQITLKSNSGSNVQRPVYLIGAVSEPTIGDYAADTSAYLDPIAVACDAGYENSMLNVSQASVAMPDSGVLYYAMTSAGTSTDLGGPMTVTLRGFTDKYI